VAAWAGARPRRAAAATRARRARQPRDAARRPGRRPPRCAGSGTWDAPLGELAALARTNCQAAALLRFARAPFWFPVAGDSLHVGDLRYDREPGLGFAELRVRSGRPRAPPGVPPWRPPRADLIDAPIAAGNRRGVSARDAGVTVSNAGDVDCRRPPCCRDCHGRDVALYASGAATASEARRSRRPGEAGAQERVRVRLRYRGERHPTVQSVYRPHRPPST
jgi:hypothetical protein